MNEHELRKRFVIGIAVIVLSLGAVSTAQSASDAVIKEKRTGIELSKERSWLNKRYSLAFIGVWTVKAYFFNVKVCALAAYVDRDDNEFVERPNVQQRQDLIAGENAKMLVLHMNRNVAQQDMQDQFRGAVTQDLPNLRENSGDLDHLVDLIPAVSKGDELQFTWLPGGGLELVFDARSRARFNNDELARAIWSVLLGVSEAGGGAGDTGSS